MPNGKQDWWRRFPTGEQWQWYPPETRWQWPGASPAGRWQFPWQRQLYGTGGQTPQIARQTQFQYGYYPSGVEVGPINPELQALRNQLLAIAELLGIDMPLGYQTMSSEGLQQFINMYSAKLKALQAMRPTAGSRGYMVYGAESGLQPGGQRITFAPGALGPSESKPGGYAKEFALQQAEAETAAKEAAGTLWGTDVAEQARATAILSRRFIEAQDIYEGALELGVMPDYMEEAKKALENPPLWYWPHARGGITDAQYVLMSLVTPELKKAVEAKRLEGEDGWLYEAYLEGRDAGAIAVTFSEWKRTEPSVIAYFEDKKTYERERAVATERGVRAPRWAVAQQR